MMLVLLILFSSATSTFGQTSQPETQAPSPSPVAVTTNPTSDPTFSPVTLSPTVAPTLPPPPTLVPTRGPTGTPSAVPTPSPSSSASPTVSSRPTESPTITFSPSHSPSLSLSPSASPTQSPTVSFKPTSFPSVAPTGTPTASPSDVPSQLPTFERASVDQAGFRTQILISQRVVFNATEEMVVARLYESYTDDFAPEAIRTVTSCRVQGQQIFDCGASNPLCTDWGVNVSDPNSQEGYLNFLDFLCSWTSNVTDVNGYPTRLQRFTDNNGDLITSDMQRRQLAVIRAHGAVIARTPSPTSSPVAAPSVSPRPTSAPRNPPTGVPSFSPTASPTVSPSIRQEERSPSYNPTHEPTFAPSSSPASGGGGSDGPGAGVVAGVVSAVAIIAVVGVYMFYRHRKKTRPPMNNAPPSNEPRKSDALNPSYKIAPGGYVVDQDSEKGQVQALISPSESLVSKHSLISAPNSGLGDESDPEVDGTRNLQDEFDQYKDQNLDNFRSEVEGNMPGFEGVMSAAVTRALMGDEEHEQDIPDEAYWGCTGTPSGPEIEASALWEVDDWLKRNEVGAVDRKRVFFADILNRMVTSVRFGVVQAEDASRTIHESAALLNLQLVNELPMTTVIISGMRKTADASHMLKVLRAFGDIDVAAVASRQKGFGIVRFRNPKSVDKVMLHYKKDEIEIQEVAVQVKALMPNGTVVGRTM